MQATCVQIPIGIPLDTCMCQPKKKKKATKETSAYSDFSSKKEPGAWQQPVTAKTVKILE